MSTSNDNSGGGDSRRPINYIITPLWRYTTIEQHSVDGGGNRVWKCNFCGKRVKSSYSKVKSHLLGIRGKGVGICDKLTEDIKDEIKREEEEAENNKLIAAAETQQRVDYLSLPPGSDLKQPKKRKGIQSSAIAAAFKAKDRDDLDKQCLRVFISTGMPFNHVRNPYFISFCTNLANSGCTNYKPPPYNRMRTTLLLQEKEHLNKLQKPTRDSWVKKGVSLCSDGWSDGSGKPIINIMAASGTSAVFIDSVDASGRRKDAAYVADVFFKAIEEVGAAHIVQIVTDNGPNFKAAGAIVEARYPSIFWTPCVVHCVNLAFKSLCEPAENSAHYEQCQWLHQLVTYVREIQKFVTTYDMVKSVFKKHTKLQLLSVAETRFASHYVVAKRMKEVKSGLENTVMDPDFRALFRLPKNPIDIKARECKEKILSDTWWDNLDYFLQFAEPIYEMIRVGDKDAPILHLVYDMWDTMIERVKVRVFEHEGKDVQSDTSTFFDSIQQVLESRWNKSNTPLHCLAHSLVPRFYSTNWLKNSKAGFPRVAPNEDEEVSNHRMARLRRLFPDDNDFKHARLEYGAFSSEAYPFNQAHIVAACDEEDPIIWWANYGASLPHLQSLAFRLLSQPASSSCCERNWSDYGNIVTLKRNRVTSKRARDLVYCHNNLRHLSRKEESYKCGPSRYWDIGGDKFDVDSELCELAELSIDEPELERAILGVGTEDAD